VGIRAGAHGGRGSRSPRSGLRLGPAARTLEGPGSLYRRGRPPQHRGGHRRLLRDRPVRGPSPTSPRFDGVRYGYQEKGCANPRRAARQEPLAWLRARGEEAADCSVPISSARGSMKDTTNPARSAHASYTQDYLHAYEQCDVILMPASPRYRLQFARSPTRRRCTRADMFTISTTSPETGGISVAPWAWVPTPAFPSRLSCRSRLQGTGRCCSLARAIERGFSARGVVAPDLAGKGGELA